MLLAQMQYYKIDIFWFYTCNFNNITMFLLCLHCTYISDNVETNDVSIADIESCNGAGSYRVEGKALIARQFLALVIKRFHVLLRSKKGFVAQVSDGSIFVW